MIYNLPSPCSSILQKSWAAFGPTLAIFNSFLYKKWGDYQRGFQDWKFFSRQLKSMQELIETFHEHPGGCQMFSLGWFLKKRLKMANHPKAITLKLAKKWRGRGKVEVW